MARRGWEDKIDLDNEDPYGGDLSDDKIFSKKESNCVDEQNLWRDYKLVKKTIRDSIEINKEVITVLLDEIEDNPTARLAEVIARLSESMASSSTQLLNASKTIAEIFKIGKDSGDTMKDKNPLFNNAIIVGSVDDILKLKEANINNDEIKKLK